MGKIAGRRRRLRHYQCPIQRYWSDTSLQVFRGDLDLAPVHMTSRALLQPWNLRVLNGPRLLSGVADRLRAYRVRDFRLQMHCAANHHRIVSPALVSLRKSSR